MTCINHPELSAVAYCRACGKALCESCRRVFDGTIYCEEHLPVPAPASAPPPSAGYSPYTAPAPPPMPDMSASPGLAFLLGLIPGVGAIYNGQYVKGLVHVIILGVLISIVNSGDAAGGMEPLFGMMIGVWVFYMAFEAYHTAKKRQMGQQVDEFSSLVPLRGHGSHFPVAPAILIGFGLLFLLNNMEIIRFSQFIRYWPIALIGLGVYMLYERVSATASREGSRPTGVGEASHERH
ncbi:MAG TPA: B-box zinc finger protein [Bryobacteraceae bacterium]|nr:B-box zinc finger protein [Bryobacteraceae bacterium]